MESTFDFTVIDAKIFQSIPPCPVNAEIQILGFINGTQILSKVTQENENAHRKIKMQIQENENVNEIFRKLFLILINDNIILTKQFLFQNYLSSLKFS